MRPPKPGPALAFSVALPALLPRTLKPLDEGTIIRSVSKTGRALIVHEACRTGGYGGELAAVIAGSEAFDYLDAPVLKCTGKDVPMPYAANLEKLALVTVPEIVEAAKAVTYR